jgi:hypothetical protein
MFRRICLLLTFILALASAFACGGIEGPDDSETQSTTEDPLVKYTGIDGSDQTCEECCCGTDALGNCIVTDLNGGYLAMCGTCTENAYGGVTYTPRPVARPRAGTGR